MTSLSYLCPKFVAPGQGERLHAPGGDISIAKIGSAESGGTFQFNEYEVPPGGGPPLHVHTLEDEAFFVLEGEVNFFISEPGDRTGKTGKRVIASKGSFVFAPRNAAHTFRNCSKQSARTILIINPGANFEAFFEKVGAPGADGKAPSEHELVARIMKYSPEHGITILGPNPL